MKNLNLLLLLPLFILYNVFFFHELFVREKHILVYQCETVREH